MLRIAEPTESKERTLRKHASREQKQEKIALPPEQRPLPYPQPFPEWVSVMHFRWQARSLEDRISHNSARVHRTFSWSVLILCDPHNSSYRRSGHDLAPFFQMWGHRWGDAAPPRPRPAPPRPAVGGGANADPGRYHVRGQISVPGVFHSAPPPPPSLATLTLSRLRLGFKTKSNKQAKFLVCCSLSQSNEAGRLSSHHVLTEE